MQRIPALDGLRGLAVLIVVAYHLPIGVFGLGAFGVTLFFVLSGYLITTLLLRELEATGRVDLKAFYARRSRRLLPALMAVVAGVWLILAVFGDRAAWWGEVWPSLFYAQSFVSAAGQTSGLMNHAWSLAVEEHFYLLWPIILPFIPSRRRWAVVIGLLGAAVIWRSALTGFDRIYFSSDGNAFAILAGCVLAVGRFEMRLPRVSTRLGVVATIGLLVISFIPGPDAGSDPRLVRWSVLAVVLSVIAVHGVEGSKLLETRSIRWFGQISYGLYLWHHVIFYAPLPWDSIPLPVVSAPVASIVLAGLSWRYVEHPILTRSRGDHPERLTDARPATAAS